MQTSMVGREARKFGYMKTAVAAVATAAMTENGSNTISSVVWLNKAELLRALQFNHPTGNQIGKGKEMDEIECLIGIVLLFVMYVAWIFESDDWDE